MHKDRNISVGTRPIKNMWVLSKVSSFKSNWLVHSTIVTPICTMVARILIYIYCTISCVYPARQSPRKYGSKWTNDLCVYTVYISYLANQTVVFPADGAVEDIDCVLVHTPARTVWSGTVVAAFTSRLCHWQTSLQPALILLCWHQL